MQTNDLIRYNSIMLTTRAKGQIAQLRAELEAQKRNISISRPTTEVRYDLILDDGKEIKRVQIKYCDYIHPNNYLQLNLSKQQSNYKPYSKKDIDFLLVYCPQLDKILAYGPDKFHNKQKILINIKNKNSKNYYEKYIW